MTYEVLGSGLGQSTRDVLHTEYAKFITTPERMIHMKSINATATGLALLVATTLAACAGDVYRSNGHYPGSAGSAYSADEAMAARVRSALAADARVGAATLTVKVVNNVVELGGTPNDAQARDLALRITERLRGVRSVINNMVLN